MEISEAKKSVQKLLQYYETPAQAPPKLLQECVSFINRKYKALCLVSVGGEGIILKVLDETNQKICIKICKAGLSSESSRKSHDAIIYNVISFMRKGDLKNIPEERFKAGTILQRNLFKELSHNRITFFSVPQVYDLRSDPFLFVSMEWMESPGLIRFLTEKNNMPTSLSVFKNILSGVDFLHERGILHRDWKSDNIFVDGKDGTPIVVDWTLAKELGDRNLTIPGTMGGTPGFAPEKFIEEKNFKAANYLDDLYQLGFLFWEVCCQQRLPKLKVESCTVKHIEAFRKDLVESLPDACQPIFWKATERLEKDRYQSAKEFKERIEELAQIFTGEKEYIPKKRTPEVIEYSSEIIVDTKPTDIYECENCGKCNSTFPCKNFRKSIIDIVLEMKNKGII